MRHRKNFNHLGRKKAHREAMLANMACSLIQHKRINTTVAKAKALRKFVEPLISKSKTDNTHSRRVVFSDLQNKEAVSELFRAVAPKVADRPGGYTRIIKTGNRLGDSADMCLIELVDFNELMLQESKSKKKRTRRAGRKKATTEAAGGQTEAKGESKESAAKPEESKATAEPQEKKAEKPETSEEAKPAEEAKKADSADDEVKAKEEPKKEEPKKEEPREEEKKEAKDDGDNTESKADDEKKEDDSSEEDKKKD